ncbi:phosphotransferase [Alteribacter aurantiacus]|uniref:phosphotransferase n=1 Tax=Alteribacter aurantiacus TaxID=254410 RepID=UPI000416966F|nr:phosphotransferase [Alteribacter aurantiacus]
MGNLWDKELVIGREEAAELIAGQFPNLSPVKIEALDEGFDNTVYLVNEAYVFRFPRRKVATVLIEREARFLPELPDLGDIATPRPQFIGKPTAGYPWPFLGYGFFDGKKAYNLSDSLRTQSAKRLATFLKELHHTPVRPEWSVPADYLHRTDIEERLPKFCDRLEEIKRLGDTSLYQRLKEYQDTLTFPKEKSYTPRLVHGDLHLKNVVISEASGLIKAVIDWGDVHMGDPAVDLSFVYSFLPEAGRVVFFDAYGEVSTNTKMKAQFVSLYISVLLFLYAKDQKNEPLIHAAKDSVTRALEV